MPMSFGDKAAHVMKFMMALRNPRIASAMAAFGFSDADLQEGWALMNTVGRVKLDASGVGNDMSTLEKLDGWENRWFPIVAATLERRFPAVHAQVFKNLSQTEGPAVAVSVRTFIERFDQMAAGAGAYGAEGAQAKAVLEARGLTQTVLNDARALLESIGKVATVDASALQDPKAREKAENDLWGWYLEWSQIARTAVTQRVLLRQMGFLPTRRSKANDADDVDVDVDPTTGVITTPVTPAPNA
ncbi:MAG: hypothetical protein BGO98_11155 [Myxococcales bacterium 68-20]|nr:hypothetical protein [Myxococcales bacterium]OJY16748.1 MAG: hypothetical protein BGO98_11155 [Myxococcales bacterium 68-20]